MTVRENGYFYTDFAASAEDEGVMRSALATPYITGPSGRGPDPNRTIHEIALAYGLPEIPGHYGYDFKERRFIRMPFEDVAKPLPEPSRRILDLLGHPRLKLSRPHDSWKGQTLEVSCDAAADRDALLDALKAYRASLVKPELREMVTEQARKLADDMAAFSDAAKALPDDAREAVLKLAYPERHG